MDVDFTRDEIERLEIPLAVLEFFGLDQDVIGTYEQNFGVYLWDVLIVDWEENRGTGVGVQRMTEFRCAMNRMLEEMKL